jgi:UPF0716 protein FxsA
MAMWVFALFLAIPLIEIALFVTVGAWLTLWPVLAIVLGTGVLGVFVIRLQGLRALSEMQGALRTMQNPVSPMAHTGLILLAGVLLILPGFLTDTLGLLLLLPPLRQWIIAGMAKRMRVVSAGRPGPDWRNAGTAPYDTEAIDAEYSEIEPQRPGLRGNSRWTQD